MADIVGFFWTEFIKAGVISGKVVSRRNGLSTLLMAILRLYKNEVLYIPGDLCGNVRYDFRHIDCYGHKRSCFLIVKL